MVSQIFKSTVPNTDLFNLLDNICYKNEKQYVLNIDSFKKGVFKDLIQIFFENIKPYYHISKRRYIEKKLTYNSFITVIRQICNYNKITYTSKIKYDKSNYELIYHIYI